MRLASVEIDVAGLALRLERHEALLPVAGARLDGEHGRARPAQRGIDLEGPLGETAAGREIAGMSRLGEETAQAKKLGLGRFEHLLEAAPDAGAVAFQLRRLHFEKLHQGLVVERAGGDLGKARGGERIARTGCDDAARQRLIALARAPETEPGAERAGRAEKPPQHRGDEEERQRPRR